MAEIPYDPSAVVQPRPEPAGESEFTLATAALEVSDGM